MFPSGARIVLDRDMVSRFSIDKGIPMKKMLLAGAAIVAALTMASAASAQSTNVGANWNGAGSFNFTANGSGSSSGAFSTFGANSAIGSVSYVNQGNNPYGYGVSNTSLNANATVGGGGFIQSSMTRDGSGAMYGAAGQSIVSFVGTDDGTAALVQHSNVNYASMNDVGYGQARTAGGNTLEVSGTNFQLGYNVDTGVAGNNGGLSAIGTGSAAIVQNFSGAGANGFNLGNGGGILTGANFSANGTGQLSYGAISTGSVNVLGMGQTVVGTQANPASFSATLNYSGAQNWTNWALTGASSGACTSCTTPN